MSTGDRSEWDRVDEAGWESFPASDPPGFGSSRAAPSQTTVAADAAAVERLCRARRRRRRIRRAVDAALPVLVLVAVWKVARLTR